MANCNLTRCLAKIDKTNFWATKKKESYINQPNLFINYTPSKKKNNGKKKTINFNQIKLLTSICAI